MAKQSLKDKKIEVVSANIGRKRKQKRNKSTLEPRNQSRAKRSQRTNKTIKQKEIWDLGSKVIQVWLGLLVLSILKSTLYRALYQLRLLRDQNASNKEKQRIRNIEKEVTRQEIKEQPLLKEIQESEHDYITKLNQKSPEEQPQKRASDKRIGF